MIEMLTMNDIDQNPNHLEQGQDYSSENLSRLQENKKRDNTQRGMTKERNEKTANTKHDDHLTEQHHRIRSVPW
jgi:hypothetical protein